MVLVIAASPWSRCRRRPADTCSPTSRVGPPPRSHPHPRSRPFLLYSEVNRRAQYWGRKELVASPVGQIVSRMDRVRSSREVVLDMATEYLEVVEPLGAEELGAE